MVERPSSAAWRRTRRILGVLGIGVPLAVVLTGCSVDDAFALGWPDSRPTPQSREMFDLWIGSIIAALAVGAFVWGLIFWCVIRYRKKSDELPPQTRYNLPMELLFTVTPFLVIAVLFYYTVTIQNSVNKLSANPDQTIEVNAFKWNWQFVYPGTDADAATADDQPVATTGDSTYVPVLVVPTDQTVQFVLNSQDVIHSFWTPDLLFKRDVMPGVENRFEVTIEQEGAYVGRCAELCGAYHSMMNFELRAVTGAEFEEYMSYREDGMSAPEALEAIGQEPYAVTTEPFDTKPDIAS